MSAAPDENLSPAEAMLLRECNRRAVAMDTLAILGVPGQHILDAKHEARQMAGAAASLIRKGLADLWVEDRCLDENGESEAEVFNAGRQPVGQVRPQGVLVLVPTERGMKLGRSEGGAEGEA
jgi:hypothetical protein